MTALISYPFGIIEAAFRTEWVRMQKMIVSLREPATPETAERAARMVQERFGGDIERIRTRLLSPGGLARFNTVERAEAFAALLRDAGLNVDVTSEDGEFAWSVGATPTPATAAGAAATQPPVVNERRAQPTSGRAALIGAIACLILGGLIAYSVPLLLLVFGPLFLAAFVLSIVAIAQGSTVAGILLLVVSLVVGPVMSVTAVTRMLFPGFSDAWSSPTSPAPMRESDPLPSADRQAGVETRANEDQPLTEPAVDGLDYAQYLEIYDFEATRINTFLDENVAAVRFKVRNDGDRTVTRLRVTAYFRDADNRVISEDSFTVVSSLAIGTDTLRTMHPGYIFQMPSGRYFTSSRVPDEWDVGNAVLQVSTIELE